MYVIVGLGNPGEEYANTRHNIGFMVVDQLNEQVHGHFKKGKGQYLVSRVQIQHHSTLLIKPLTYMNLSGQAVKQVVNYYKITDLSKMLIVLDDFNLPFGTLRLRPQGSAGGQKGLQSILQIMQTNEIPRLRIGIGNGFNDPRSYVLSPFSASERKILPDLITESVAAIESFIQQGIEYTMSRYNRNIFE